MNGHVLAVKDLAVAFNDRVVVGDVDFTLDAGETLAIVGESGSGKSVSALSILKLLPYPAASHPAGQILFEGEDLLKASPQRLRQIRGRDISMIFQEPMTSLNPLHSVERQIGEVLRIHQGLGQAAARKKILELLTEVGIKDPETRLESFPHQLSGGQRQRVMIAMALANEPKILIADEPTTALDVTIQAQILDLLKRIQRERNMAILFITHDLGIVRQMADRVAVMQLGEVVEFGTVEEVFKNPQHDYTKMLLAAGPKGRPPAVAQSGAPLLKLEDVKVWFPIKRGLLRRVAGHIKAVNGVDAQLWPGRTLGVVGESGSGKTTLGLAVLRLLGFEGEVQFEGRDIARLGKSELRDLREDMQIVFQDPFGALSPRMTIAGIVAEGLDVHRPELGDAQRDERVITALEEVGLDPETRHRYPHEFSGGQRQRVAIARALVLEPKLVVLDEPTSALDISVQTQIVDLLRKLQAEHQLSYIFISHDLNVVRALAHNLIIMRNGEVVEAGPAEDVFESPQNDYTKALIEAARYRELA